MRKATLIVFTAWLALLPGLAHAQASAAIQQVDTANQRRLADSTARSYETGENAPELYSGEDADVGPQSVLKVKPRRTWFEAMADAEYFYTDNMFLDHTNKQSADVLLSTVQFAVAPEAYSLGGGEFSPRLGFRQEWYTFGLASDKEVPVFDFSTTTLKTNHLSEFDFNAQTVFADGRWTRDHWIVDGGVTFRRLMDTASYSQFYLEWVPHLGVQRLFPFGDRSLLTVGYDGDYRFTSTDFPPPSSGDDFNDRTDHNVFATYTLALCKYALVQPYYRFQYTYFTKGESRNDYLNSVGLALYCFVTPKIGLRAFVGYDMLKTSSNRVPEYNKLDTGGGLNLTLRF